MIQKIKEKQKRGEKRRKRKERRKEGRERKRIREKRAGLNKCNHGMHIEKREGRRKNK